MGIWALELTTECLGGVRYAEVTRTEPLVDDYRQQIMEERQNKYTGKIYNIPKTQTVTIREVVSVVVGQVPNGERWAYIDGKYQATGEADYRVATLPKKRVYRLDTKLEKLVGSNI